MGESHLEVVLVAAQEEASAEGGQKQTLRYLRVWKKSQKTSWNRDGFEILSSGGMVLVGFAKLPKHPLGEKEPDLSGNVG